MEEHCGERSLAEENLTLKRQLQFYQQYDALTGLYNRNFFYQKTAELIARYPDDDFTILCMDVEHFKLVNDLYGPDEGDRLLCHIADGIRRAFSSERHVSARLTGDIFALCIPGGTECEAQAHILRFFQNYPLPMTLVPAIGAYPVSDRTLRIGLMCDRAMMALNSVKGNYFCHMAQYDSRLRNVLLDEQEILNDAEAALEHEEFEVFLQPKCNADTSKVVGAEALVRWRHPNKGMVPPDQFIPIFERNGFVTRLDLYVWDKTAAWLRRWIDQGHRPVPVSVNISRIDIYSMDVCTIFQNLMQHYHLNPALLQLEITESAYVSSQNKIIYAVGKLMENGFTVLMDDFGSGYSSLNMLQDINIDILKIDMKFLDHDNQKSKGILESIIHMSRWLNLPVIAEGVETQNQVDFLLSIGCIYAQGYFYYRPMPLPDFEALLLDGSKVDYADSGKLRAGRDTLLDFTDLFHRDTVSDRLLGNILGAVALYSFDGKQLTVLRANKEFYALTGHSIHPSEQELDIFSAVVEEDLPIFLDGLARAKSAQDESGATICIRKRLLHRIRWIQIRLFHLSEQVRSDIYYGALSDVTDQMEAMEQLRISEERFRIAMQATHIVIFELDVETRTVHCSPHAQQVFGLDATTVSAPEGFIRQGAVCAGYEDAFREVYDAIYRGEDRASCVILSKMADGTVTRNRVTLSAIRNRSGRTVKAVGMVEKLETLS